ncbi:MAG TPA: CBS domain-containing protein [Beijerinckiaceae bacterium]|nr:CBS domain-containing protein [Beijerinckiaceae bacterium]
MTVERILADKGSEVVTIEPRRSLAEAARLLAERRIGAIVAAEGGRVLGILSERDIVRAVAGKGPSSLDEPVSAHMTAEVFTCTGEMSITEVMEVMTARKFRHMPVVEGGRLVGIVSIGDVVKNRLAELEAEEQALREYIATA